MGGDHDAFAELAGARDLAGWRELPAFAGLSWHDLPATGAALHVPGAVHSLPDQACWNGLYSC